jgi:phosphoglucomutase
MLRRNAGIVAWRVINYEGTEAREGIGNRTGSESGGLKVMLTDSNGLDVGFLWMRGSKTEPVFRIMVDIEGHRPELENELLQWLREMVATAAAHQ